MENPERFERLKYETFERWSREDIKKEAKTLREKREGEIPAKNPDQGREPGGRRR